MKKTYFWTYSFKTLPCIIQWNDERNLEFFNNFDIIEEDRKGKLQCFSKKNLE